MKFNGFAQKTANASGHPKTFCAAIALVVVWASTGPYFHYNETWQLVINTSTTIITFLMVFLIQNTQNRDNDILHIKIDELLRATKEAQNAVMNLDDLDEKELKTIRKKYRKVGANETVEVSESETVLMDSPGALPLGSSSAAERDKAAPSEELASDPAPKHNA
jgi:low affinity Fe/Cu permease